MRLVTKKLILGALIAGVIILPIIGFCFLRQPSLGRTNFLILGVAGKERAGGDLTDTTMFISVNNQTGKTLLLSLPRDIWITPLRTKLNSVYHYQGLEKTKETVSQILGQSIDYGIIIDFNVFTKIVDALGGVEVNVERTFDDYQYPIAGKENDLCNGDLEYKCRYEHLHFDAGKQKMDGETALKYVRSRNAEGEEGTDFAREKRQQKLILAIKGKILSPRFFLDLGRPLQLIKVLKTNIQTDIPKEKYGELFRLALKFKNKNLKMEILNNGYLINPPTSKKKYDNQWVLIPKTETWEEVQKYVATLLETP